MPSGARWSLSYALLWAYPLLIALAEIVTVVISAQAGLIAHGLLLMLLAMHRALARHEAEQQLAMALLLAPLLHVLALALPLSHFPQTAWLGLISAPLLLAAWLVTGRLRLSPRELGLRAGDLPLQALIAGGGPVLGAAAYGLLRPTMLTGDLEPGLLVLPVVAFMLCGGFTEELIFRGVIQATALRALGRWAIFYGALVFAVLQIGYRSPAYMLLAMGVGLLFASTARRSGSILGVTLAHGLANLTLLLWMPYAAANPTSPAARLAPWAIGLSGLLVLSALVYLLMRGGGRAALPRLAALRPRRAVDPWVAAAPSGPVLALRDLRERANLTIVGLALACGIPARVLAEIELGLRPISPALLGQIARSLQSDPRQPARPAGA